MLLMFSTGVYGLDRILNDGYPEKSGILVVGPPGIGKEALGYWFAYEGLSRGDFCLYVTRLTVSEVLQDTRAFEPFKRGLESLKASAWVARDEGEVKCDLNDQNVLPRLSFSIKETIRKNRTRPIRIVTDILSPLLALNTPETVYRFISQLLSEVKEYNAVFLSTIEDRMHHPQVLASMEQLFDGVVQLRLYEKGQTILPLLRPLKMRGHPPDPEYFHFSFRDGRMEIEKYARQ